MSNNYDNWERLVAAVLRREQDREVALADSRESSFRSISSSSRFEPDSSFHDQNPQLEPYNSNTVNLLGDETGVGVGLSFHLDKRTGKKCYMIGAKELAISWGDKPMYWEWKSHMDSRFSMVANLLTVWWLDIRGSIDTKMLSPKTQYVVYLVYRLAPNFYGLGSANAMIKFLVREDDAEAEKRATTLLLQPPGYTETNSQNAVARRPDGWMEVVMGHFYNDKGDEGIVEARLLEIHSWKGGLIVEGIEFRPLNANGVEFSKKDVKTKKKGLFSKFRIRIFIN